MYNFELCNPTKIIFGKTGRRDVGKIAAAYGKKALVVYGSDGIKQRGLFSELANLLKKENIEIIEFGGVQPNPRSKMATDGGRVCREKDIDLIIAVGGGSVIDCSKAISMAAYYDGDYWDIVDKKVAVEQALPLMVISTNAGTGTEMNNSCVITNDKLKIKRGYNSECIRPKVSFLDPCLTFSVNPFQTACGAPDTFSHIRDTAYMVIGNKMQLLDGVMESLCKTVIKYGPLAIKEPHNYEARANLMWAAAWGLNGFLKNGIRQLAACHAIEHELSAQYDIVHGLGMAILMPHYYEYVLNEENVYLYENLGKHVFGVDQKLPAMVAAREMLTRMREFLFNELRLPSTLSDVGVTNDKFRAIADNICWGGKLPGLMELTNDDVFEILNNAF